MNEPAAVFLGWLFFAVLAFLVGYVAGLGRANRNDTGSEMDALIVEAILRMDAKRREGEE